MSRSPPAGFTRSTAAFDGGAVTARGATVARMVTLLRFNAEDREAGEYHYRGYRAPLDNVQTAVLDVKLRHLPTWVAQHHSIAAR
jgi:dTDP-4-amino-4,6-dideoxygalactose transaminase